MLFILDGEVLGNIISSEDRPLSTHLHQEEPHDEGAALAVAHLPVVDAVGLHHVEQRLLAHAALLLEEVVLRVGPGDVSPEGCYHYNHCLRRRNTTRT